MYISPWLVVIVIIVVFFYLRMRKRNKKNFSPFNLTIIPNWEFLLKDYNLADDKKIEELNKIIYSSEGSYSVLRNGISFTVLQSNEQTDLIYNNTLHTFHSEVDFEEQIREIKLTTPELLLPYSPRFYVKWGIGGYKLGITTPESSKKVIMAGDNNDKVEITTVPYALFNMPKYRLGLKEKHLKTS